jgi:hypothetical protein
MSAERERCRAGETRIHVLCISSGVKKIQSVLGLEFETTDLELQGHRHDE